MAQSTSVASKRSTINAEEFKEETDPALRQRRRAAENHHSRPRADA
jgi:hypothetical protein